MSSKTTIQEQDVQLEIKPLTGRIGAEIKNVKLSDSLNSQTIKAIRQALLKYKVIFFKEQHHLNDAGQEGFASLLGKPEAHPTVPTKEDTDFILELDTSHGNGKVDSWHTDVTFVDAYPEASILRAVKIPEIGGDTVWANTVAAYEDLPEELKALADRLWALHTNDFDYASTRVHVDEDALQRSQSVLASKVIETEHPLVRVHPETGEHALILGHFVKRILGLSTNDSAHLYSIFQNYVTRLENTVRWKWSEGDIAIWDNRATQHYAVNDYGDAHRVVRRITLQGDVPVSIDGQRSKTRQSNEEEY